MNIWSILLIGLLIFIISPAWTRQEWRHPKWSVDTKWMHCHLRNRSAYRRISRVAIFRPVSWYSLLLFLHFLISGCLNDDTWQSSRNYNCRSLETTLEYCSNGKFTSASQVNGGTGFGNADRHCCACGKGLRMKIASFSWNITLRHLVSLPTILDIDKQRYL